MTMYLNEERDKQRKPYIGINFRILISQLTEEYKLKVAFGEVKPKEVFNISETAESFFIDLIKKDLGDKLKLPREKSNNKNLLTTIINQIKNEKSKLFNRIRSK